MKRIILSLTIAITSISFSNAQEIGLRFGAFDGHGYLAIDGAFDIDQGRIHADMSFNHGGLGFDALWDVIYKDLKIESETFQWYLGAGANTYIHRDYFGLGVIAEVGIEHHFSDAPIVIGLDWRPGIYVIPDTYLHLVSLGLNVRYVF